MHVPSGIKAAAGAVALASAPALATDPCDAGQPGSTGVTLDIDDKGKPTACRVDQSSGIARLDEASCRISLKRVRFKPATNESGQPIASTYSYKVRWQCGDAAGAKVGPNGHTATAVRSALDISRQTIPR